MGLTLLDTAEGVLDIVGDYVQRIRDLTEQAANGTYGTASLQAIRTEVQQRMLEINRLCEVIDFNGIQLLDGTSTAARTKAGVNLQVGNNSGAANVINLDYTLFESAKFSALIISGNSRNKNGYGVAGAITNWFERADANEDTTALKARILGDQAYTGPDGKTIYDYTKGYKSIQNSLYDCNNDGNAIINPSCITAICDAVYTDDSTAREFLYFLDDAIENISARSALIGAYMNRVESAVDAISVQKENIVSANSSIKDTDVAEESSNYLKYQILQQSSATLLATANQQPQIALNLL
jgi:flagellin